jgi:hypothetical protein
MSEPSQVERGPRSRINDGDYPRIDHPKNIVRTGRAKSLTHRPVESAKGSLIAIGAMRPRLCHCQLVHTGREMAGTYVLLNTLILPTGFGSNVLTFSQEPSRLCWVFRLRFPDFQVACHCTSLHSALPSRGWHPGISVHLTSYNVPQTGSRPEVGLNYMLSSFCPLKSWSLWSGLEVQFSFKPYCTVLAWPTNK